MNGEERECDSIVMEREGVAGKEVYNKLRDSSARGNQRGVGDVKKILYHANIFLTQAISDTVHPQKSS